MYIRLFLKPFLHFNIFWIIWQLLLSVKWRHLFSSIVTTRPFDAILLRYFKIKFSYLILFLCRLCLVSPGGSISNRNYSPTRSFSLPCKWPSSSVGKQTHDLTVIASDSKTTQSGGDNRKKFPLGAALQIPQNFSFAPL